MIVYKKCSDVDTDLIYEAFKIGFSDYIIKMEVPKDLFFKRFFGAEGNHLETSFIALDIDKPIGVILGSIKDYEGIKTIRCGTLAIHPEYRGKGISKKLHDLHKEAAASAGCKQLFLEVIVGNDRAINFYKKMGYEKIYDLSYFSLSDLSKLSFRENNDIHIKEINTEELRKVFENLKDTHINWQNDIEYLEKSEGQITFGAYKDGILIGAASLNKNTRINFVWVNPEFRNKGIGTNLILKCADELKLEKLSLGFPNNSSLQGYLKHKGFTKDNISQYEMYYTV
jgi:ribosomal protein S18 acetylase RimI-like enzyme